MKKFNLLMCATLMASFLFAQTVSTFENLTLATDTFWDGSDLTGSFTSGNAQFLNDYSTSFMSWSGFVYSNKKDTATAGYGNQYSAVTGGGYSNSANYVVADDYGNAKVKLTGSAVGKPVIGFYVTNTTYTYLSMKNGDQFAKKFGGASGADEDWFMLRAIGWLNGALKQQSVDFYLADYRFADSTQDYIVRNWTWLDLQALGDVDSLQFLLTSSDTAFGFMNTPAYFAMDNFTTSDQTNVAPVAADDFVTTTYLNDTIIDVLANDFDTTATPLSVTVVGSPLISGATVTVLNNRIHYTPAVGIVAVDTFIYSLCDATLSCVTAKLVVNVTGITGLDEIESTQAKIFPNPFGNYISVSSSVIINQVELVNVTGAVVKTISSIEANVFELNTEELSAGIYFLRMNSDKGTLLKKIVKQ